MVSIIIVNYKVEKELVACISSILESKPKVKFEIIVVDNSASESLSKNLKKNALVKYIRSEKNIGYGAGNNLGVKKAIGDFLFFLNPDTIVKKGTVDALNNYMMDNPSAGMVAPLLLDPSGKVYPIQGSDEYSLLNSVVTSSFLNKLFPNNAISGKFFHKNWDKKNVEEFDVVPGTAFIISKNLFEKVRMFDEKFFLYFEEYDLAKRVKKLGYKNYIIPQAKLLHIWEVSTKKRKDIDKIFSKSRYYFFKKNYGSFFASIINITSNTGRGELMLGFVLIISAFLNLFKLGELMTFIGDQGWFYLSARDMLINGQIPLVGIASSHPWLHQGAFWTYILGILLWLFKFNPLAPGYFTAILGVIMVVLMYKVGRTMFSQRIGLISSLLYATSPLIILNDRMPYHTNLIPFFTLLFIYSLYKWIKGNEYFFPLTFLFLAVLYNFEISTALLWIPLVIFLIYGVWKKTNWIKIISNTKIFILSLLGLSVPMVPMVLYDTTHGFPQTFKFGLWIGYHIARVFGFPSIYGDQQFPSPVPFVSFTLAQLQQLVFLPNLLFTVILLLGSFFAITYLTYIRFKKRKEINAYIIIYLTLIISVIGFVGTTTASSAYFPLFFPLAIFMLAIGFDCLLYYRITRMLGLALIVFVIVFNSYSLLQRNYFSGKGYVPTFSEKVFVAKTIIQKAHEREYNLIGKGSGSQFASFTMNYEYLTWWLGHGPSKKDVMLKIYISELTNGIKIEERNIKK